MKELEKIATLNPLELFKAGGIQQVIDGVRGEVLSIVPDTSTSKGRKEIASLAHKIAKSKTLIDKMGKALADDLNAQLKPINVERKLARDEFDKLRDEIREPLTAWEDEKKAIEAAESARLAAEKLADEVEQAHEVGLLLNDKRTRDRIQAAEDARIDLDRAHAERDEKIAERARLQAEQKAAGEKAELIKREEQAKRAVIIADENARRAKEQAERDAIIAADQAEQSKLQAQRDAVAAAERAEQAKVNAVQQAEENAKRERDELAQREREEKERLKSIADAAAQDKKNIALKCTQAVASIEALGVDTQTARQLVISIHRGQVENVKIVY